MKNKIKIPIDFLIVVILYLITIYFGYSYEHCVDTKFLHVPSDVTGCVVKNAYYVLSMFIFEIVAMIFIVVRMVMTYKENKISKRMSKRL